MKFVLENFAFETTRRCNLRCGHCMRGEPQNIDMSTDIVDMILDSDEIKSFIHILFSGGEPTLNPGIIIYTINKIISDRIDVDNIGMVTNGQIFNRDIVEAFNRFNEYVNERNLENLDPNFFKEMDENHREMWRRNKIDNHVRISFSTDRYHNPVPDDVRNSYNKYSRGLVIDDYCFKDGILIKTGFSTAGKDFEYALQPLYYWGSNEQSCLISNFIYVTANGYVTSEGMGQYVDMDRVNYGHISSFSFNETFKNNGEPLFKKKTKAFLKKENK